jgi:adenylate kinase
MAKHGVILFLGAPGSGKGTQSLWLSEQLGVPRLSTGDMLRAEAQEDTPAGNRLRRVLASGSLVPDEIVCEAAGARLLRCEPGNGIILDGFPRTLTQARYLDRMLERMGLPPARVLHLCVSHERLLERLTARRQCSTCGAIFNLLSRPSSRGNVCEYDGGTLFQREDDHAGAIQRRMHEFESSFGPLVEYYAGADYYRIDGDREPRLVSSDLIGIFRHSRASVAA